MKKTAICFIVAFLMLFCACSEDSDKPNTETASELNSAIEAVNSEKRFTVARELLNEASASWGVYEAAKEGAPIKSQKIGGSKQDSVDICAKDDLILLVKKQDEQNISKSIDVYELKAPLKAGDKAGELAVTLPDGKKYTVDLIVSEDVEQASVGVSFKRIAALWINAA